MYGHSSGEAAVFQYHKQLRSFHAVAERGGFTAAAAFLNIGQPTVTEQVRDLEDRFGVELFFRRGKQVLLSPAGAQLLQLTKELFGHEVEAIELLERLKGQQVGVLRVGTVSPPIGVAFVARMNQAQPGLKVELSLATESEVHERLCDFRIDIGIWAQSGQAERLHIVPYESHSLVVVVPDAHPLARRRGLSLQELAQQPLLMREAASRTRQVLEQAAAAAGISLQPRLEINSREAIFHAVRAGMGLSVVNEVEFAPMKGLVSVPLERRQLRIDYFLCCLASRRERPLLKVALSQFGQSSR